MPTLPVETLRTIFEHINDKKSLLNVLLSCRQFSQVVEPLLYTQVTIRGPYFGGRPTMAGNLKCLLEAIEASDGCRALYVRSLLFRARLQDDEEVQLINTIVMKLKKLKTLSLPFQSQWPSSPTVPFTFLEQNPIFSLREFRYPDPTSDQALARFLGCQTSLEMLQFIWKSEDLPDLSPSALPNTKILMCNLATFSHFAHSPARITHLAIQGLDEKPWKSTVAFTSRIRVLSLSLADDRDIKVLVSFASVFPNLQWLEISGSVNVVSCLRALRKYSGNEHIRGIRFLQPHPESPQSQLYDLFSAMPSLEFVEYCKFHDEYQRWFCDELGPKPIKWACEDDRERWRADWEQDVTEVKEEPIRGSTPTRWRPWHSYARASRT